MYEITVNRRNNPAYEAMFNDLIQEVFGFTFAPWFKLGLWDERYESYSIIENGVMLSNLCIFKTEMLIKGRKVQANQFGAVATRKSVRGKGLARILMEHVLSLYPDTPAYLAANPSVIDFYPRFGFRQVKTYVPTILATINNNPATAVKYSINDVANFPGRQYSNVVDCLNTQSINIFHLLMEYADDIYFLPEHDTIVIAKQEENELFIADVIVQKPITFDEIKKALPFAGVDEVEFGFCPDWLGVSPEWELADMNESPFFLRGEWNLPENYRFPAMSET